MANPKYHKNPITSEMTLADLAKLHVQCAWKGCTNSVSMQRKPRGWVNLLVWFSAEPEPWKTVGQVAMEPGCKRDAALCPEHAKELEDLLWEAGNWLNEPAAGRA